MTIQDIPLFQVMGAKMSYLDRRQTVIAQNVANADTPGYRARDLTEVDFGAVLKEVSGNRVQVEKTDPHHISPNSVEADPKVTKSKITYEVAPDDNTVIIEEQMVKATETSMDYSMLTNLMRKNINMIRTALGAGQ